MHTVLAGRSAPHPGYVRGDQGRALGADNFFCLSLRAELCNVQSEARPALSNLRHVEAYQLSPSSRHGPYRFLSSRPPSALHSQSRVAHLSFGRVLDVSGADSHLICSPFRFGTSKFGIAPSHQLGLTCSRIFSHALDLKRLDSHVYLRSPDARGSQVSLVNCGSTENRGLSYLIPPARGTIKLRLSVRRTRNLLTRL